MEINMQYIIDFANSSDKATIAKYLSDEKMGVVAVLSDIQNCYLVNSDTYPKSNEIIDSIVLDSDSPIKLLSSTYEQVTFATHTESNWWKMASFTKPDFNLETQSYDRRGAKSTVYVVDSGVSALHPEFRNAKVTNLFSFNGDFTDYNGHGTAIASVISGETCGVTNAEIKSVKVFQSGVSTLQSHLVAAFDAILLDVIANPLGMKIVNLSWGVSKNLYLESKIQALVDANIIVITAAGNSGIPIENVTPASMDSVFTIGAYNQNFQPCDFSNYTGPISTTLGESNYGALDCWAPGELISAATLDNLTSPVGGTSIAAAIMAAAFAYNADANTLASGEVPNDIFERRDNLHSIINNGILTLNGKYSGSVNVTCVFRGEYDGFNGVNYATVSNFMIVAESGKSFAKLVAPLYIIDSFSIADPLPTGMVLDSSGWLVGAVETTELLRWESDVTYTKHNGFVKHSKLTVIIVPELPAGEVLDYTLYTEACAPVLNNSSGNYYCGGYCIGGSCHDTCGQTKASNPSELDCACPNDLCP
jgi:subtilisin family serine protease